MERFIFNVHNSLVWLWFCYVLVNTIEYQEFVLTNQTINKFKFEFDERKMVTGREYCYRSIIIDGPDFPCPSEGSNIWGTINTSESLNQLSFLTGQDKLIVQTFLQKLNTTKTAMSVEHLCKINAKSLQAIIRL